MMTSYEFISIWISPTGDALNCDTESHSKAIASLGLDREIAAYKDAIRWSEKELRQGYDRDDVICLMKIGWVRVAAVADQIGVEHCGILNKQKNTICEFIKGRKTTNERQQNVVVENFSTGEYEVFSSISAACAYVMSMPA